MEQPLAGWACRELLGHKRRVCTLGWSGNGKKLASGSADQGVRVWSVEHCQVSRAERAEVELKGHQATISHLAWKPGPQSDTLASTTAGEKSDKSIRLWDVRSGKCASVVNTNMGNLYVTWCPDGSSYAAISESNVLSIIDARKARVMRTHKFQTNIYEIEWGPSAGQFMAATEKGSVDVMSFPSMEVLCSLRGHASQAYCFAMNKNQKCMVSGGGDALVAFWDLESLLCTRTWAHMDHPVRSVSLSADASYVAYATELGELEILSTKTGERLAELRLRTAFSDSVAWNPVHNVLAYCEEVQDPGVRDRLALVGAVGIFAPPKQQ